jgi:hypothetical protein
MIFMFKAESGQTYKEPAEKEVSEKNIVRIETPEAKYNIVYGNHLIEQSSENIGLSDAVIIETGVEDYTTESKAELVMNEREVTNIQYNKIIETLAKNQKPIYFADLSQASPYLYHMFTGLLAAESIVGLSLLESLARGATKKITENKKMNRRNFLKSSIQGIAGLYLSSPLIAKLFTAVSAVESGGKSNEQSILRKTERTVDAIDESIHPELHGVLITLRNHLLAQKTTTIADSIKTNNKKTEISVVIGAGHHRIEDALKKTAKDRLEIIKKMLNSPMLNSEARANISKIARSDFDSEKGEWKASIFDDPYLKHVLREDSNNK